MKLLEENRAFLETQIKIFDNLEPQALFRLKETKRAYQEARKNYLAAKAELDNIRVCAKEFVWQLDHSGSCAS